MKSMEKLKAKEMTAIGRIGKLQQFAAFVHRKTQEYTKNALLKLQADLQEQHAIREERLRLLALEQERIRGELVDISIAHARHGSHITNL